MFEQEADLHSLSFGVLRKAQKALSKAQAATDSEDDGDYADEVGPDEEESVAPTPRIDKGKGRAEPEPEVPEKIISPPPRFIVAGMASDDEDHDHNGHVIVGEPEEIDLLEGSITTDRSRSWVQEEGEVFRKSNVLLTEEEMEGEYAGEELRREVSRGVWVQREGAKADVNFSFSSWKPWSSARRRAK